ncbi:MAG: hypothetical protein RIC55_31850 [Pirellulaceae bacterium]
MEKNPYEAPAGYSVAARKPVSASAVAWVRWSWQLPLLCIGISIAVNILAKPLGALAGLILILSIPIGFVLSVVGIFLSFKYRGVIQHAIGGILTTVFMGLAIAAMFHAIGLAREAAQKQRERDAGADFQVDP